jgi:hypothetical protein
MEGHRSLLEDGKILCRDISKILRIISSLQRLIKLDLAKDLDSMLSGASIAQAL